MASRAARRRLYAATGTLRSVQGGAAVVPGTVAVVYWHCDSRGVSGGDVAAGSASGSAAAWFAAGQVSVAWRFPVILQNAYFQFDLPLFILRGHLRPKSC